MISDLRTVSLQNKPEANMPAYRVAGANRLTAPIDKSLDKEVVIRQINKSAEISRDAINMMERLDAVIDQLNKLATNTGRGLSFSRDEQLGVNTIVVTNTSTGDVVRTIPTDVALKVARGIDNFEMVFAKFKGLLYDKST